ncbi:hypothetical protein Tco_0950238 [Tanacetum coccineum]
MNHNNNYTEFRTRYIESALTSLCISRRAVAATSKEKSLTMLLSITGSMTMLLSNTFTENYSSSSNYSFGVVPIALLTLSLFHDDPYMKVLQAFYAEKSSIPPPTIIPSSSMLNPQELFLPEELLPSKKRGCDRSSLSTSAIPQDFDIGESSCKTSLERHEEQIEEI